MTQFAEVTFNDEDAIVVAVTPHPANKEAFDFTGTIDAALKIRDVQTPQARESDDPETFTITVKRHVPEDEDAKQKRSEAAKKAAETRKRNAKKS